MIKYDWENIIKDLKSGLSRRDVEAKYKVPRSTLNSRINQKNPDLKSRFNKSGDWQSKDWKSIYLQYEAGFSVHKLSEIHKIPYATIYSMMIRFKQNPDYAPYRNFKKTQINQSLNSKKICPIMQKIEIIKMLNKQIPHAQIARELKIDVLELEKLIHKIKSGVK